MKVTDAGGLASTDTVQIRVIDPLPTVPCAGRPVININFLPIGNLSEARAGLSSGTVAGKIVFAGGWVPVITSYSIHYTKLYEFQTVQAKRPSAIFFNF